MKTSVALAALLLVSSASYADPQRVAPMQPKKMQTRDNGKPHPFNARDLVMLDRVSDPQLSPDGKRVAFQLRETDYAENKGVTSIWLLDLGARDAQPVKLAPAFIASGPRWSPDSKDIYFIGKPKGGSGKLTGVYRLHADDDKAAPEALTPYRVDVNNFKLSPDGKKLLLSIDVEPSVRRAARDRNATDGTHRRRRRAVARARCRRRWRRGARRSSGSGPAQDRNAYTGDANTNR
jgi:dipeptidyl aminopeptidase/acylaminoacyl peptidase